LDDLVQRDQDTNFNFGAVSCRFTGFTRDRKYVKNHAKNHRIAIFTADDNHVKLGTRGIHWLLSFCRLAR
jgi:hypothetical protein